MSGGDHFDYLENVFTTCEWMVNILMLGVWYDVIPNIIAVLNGGKPIFSIYSLSLL
jgi:hypothetical protein